MIDIQACAGGDDERGCVCSFCEARFRVLGSPPRRIVLEDDGESVMVGFVCPSCVVSRGAEIAAAEASYQQWAATCAAGRRGE